MEVETQVEVESNFLFYLRPELLHLQPIINTFSTLVMTVMRRIFPLSDWKYLMQKKKLLLKSEQYRF